MIDSKFQVEFDGNNYIVLKSGLVLMSIDSCEGAFDAKRDFEGKSYPSKWDKVPPAIRQAKQTLYGEAI